MSLRDLQLLFDAARRNPANPMNQPGKLMGRHCIGRLRKAKAKRVKGRVKNGLRCRAGRATFTP